MLDVVDMILKRKLEHRAQLAAWYRVFTISNSRPLKTKIHPKLPFQVLSQDLVQIQIYKSNILECADDKNKERISIFHPHSLLSTSFSHFRSNFPNAPNFTNSGRKILFMGQAWYLVQKVLKLWKWNCFSCSASYSPLVAGVFMGLDRRQVNNRHGC